MKVDDEVIKAKKQQKKTLVLLALGDDIDGGHHVLQTAEAGKKLVLFDSLLGAVEYDGGPRLKTNPVCIQSDMSKGDIICHQYSLCEALHFIDPKRYPKKPNWTTGYYDRVDKAEENLEVAKEKKKPKKEIKRLSTIFIAESKGQEKQKMNNFKIVLATIKKFIEDPKFVPAFNKTWQSEYSKTELNELIEELKMVVNVMKPKDVLDFEWDS